MASTYEITSEMLQLMDMMEDPDMDQAIVYDTYAAVAGERSYKFESCVKIIKNLEGDIAAYKKEADDFTKKAKAAEGTIKRIKSMMEWSMRMTDDTKADAGLFKVSLQNNPPSVVLDEQYIENIPEEYLKYKEPEVDKAKIKDDLKAGKDLEGIAHLEQTQSIRIR